MDETTLHPMRVGVLGGGFMGSGIAEAVARAGHSVVVYEPIPDARPASQKRLRASVAKAVGGGKLSSEQAEDLLARIAYPDAAEELADRELVIEAVVEDLEVK